MSKKEEWVDYYWAAKDDPEEGYVWEPEPDITLYELAVCLPAIVHGGYAYVEALPDECRRHWSYRSASWEASWEKNK